jgi:hypothetical protein
MIFKKDKLELQKMINLLIYLKKHLNLNLELLVIVVVIIKEEILE